MTEEPVRCPYNQAQIHMLGSVCPTPGCLLRQHEHPTPTPAQVINRGKGIYRTERDKLIKEVYGEGW